MRIYRAHNGGTTSPMSPVLGQHAECKHASVSESAPPPLALLQNERSISDAGAVGCAASRSDPAFSDSLPHPAS